MAGLFGVGGAAAKTDRKQQLNSWGELTSLFNFGSNQGKEQVKTGASGLKTAGDYFKALQSGDRAKMSSVLAPQISTIQGQTAQQRSTASQFGDRSGGTNASIQASENQATAAIQSMFELLGPDAAKEFASISGAEESAGLGLLGEAGSAASTTGAQATNARPGDQAMQSEQQTAIIQALGALAGL